MSTNLNIQLELTGEALYFLNMVKEQTGMNYEEIFSKMIDLYKQVYLNSNELAWIQGDSIVQKLNSVNLKRSNL
jgi:hypothetical protein